MTTLSFVRALGLLGALSLTAPTIASADGRKVAAPATAFDHAAFDKLLRAHARGGKVDYAAFSTDASFKAYVEAIGRFDPATLKTRDEKLAFWINAYNALTISGVVKRWPGIKSVQDVAPNFGFFKEPNYTVGGKAMSLDDIEHKTIRPEFKDPRVHAALNCASTSCPPIVAEAFVPAKLNGQLEQAFRAFARDKARNTIDEATGAVALSSIFDWFKDDFTAQGGVATYLGRALDPGPAAAVKAAFAAGKVTYLPYDWSLNKR